MKICFLVSGLKPCRRCLSLKKLSQVSPGSSAGDVHFNNGLDRELCPNDRGTCLFPLAAHAAWHSHDPGHTGIRHAGRIFIQFATIRWSAACRMIRGIPAGWDTFSDRPDEEAAWK
jgi:hypothetical protein